MELLILVVPLYFCCWRDGWLGWSASVVIAVIATMMGVLLLPLFILSNDSGAVAVLYIVLGLLPLGVKVARLYGPDRDQQEHGNGTEASTSANDLTAGSKDPDSGTEDLPDQRRRVERDGA